MEAILGYLFNSKEKIPIKHQKNAFVFINDSLQDCSEIKNENINNIEFEIVISDYQWILQDWSSNGVLVLNAKVGSGNKAVLTDGTIVCVRNQYYYELQIISALTFQKELLELQKKQIQDKQDFLEDAIICCICDKYLFQAMAIIPCMHHCCGACLSEWSQNKITCPSCNTRIENAYASQTLNNLVDKYLKHFPEQTRTMDELDQMTQTNIFHQNSNNNNNIQLFNNMNQVQQENIQQNKTKMQIQNQIEIDQYLYNNSSLRYKPTLISQQPVFINSKINHNKKGKGKVQITEPFQFVINQNFQQNSDSKCKSCERLEWKGFQCKEGQEHVGCNSCYRKIPKRMINSTENYHLKMYCSICQVYDCRYYYEDCVKAKENKFLLVKDLQIYIILLIKHVLTKLNNKEYQRILEVKMKKLSLILCVTTIYLKAYLSSNRIVLLFHSLKQISNPLYMKIHPICYMCGPKLLVQIIWKYVQVKKTEHEGINTPDCPLGINCQSTGKGHCQQYNHMCKQTKFD